MTMTEIWICLLSGLVNYWPWSYRTRVYKNENGILVESCFELSFQGQIKWMDYDNNGYLDIIVGQSLYHQENNIFNSVSIVA